MKKIFSLLTLALVSVLFTQNANAHAVWIETNAQGKKNKAQEIKVFYGEYTEGAVDPLDKWYSDLKSLELWVISPGKQKTRLDLTPGADHLKAEFTPTEDGVYYLTTVHATKDLGGTTKYEFSSVAPVATGTISSSLTSPDQSLAIFAAPKAYKVNNNVELQVYKGGQPYVDGEVIIMSPEGWVKTLKSDSNGRVSFVPKLKGNYVIETSEYKEEAGQWHDKAYTHSWKGSTTRILVN